MKTNVVYILTREYEYEGNDILYVFDSIPSYRQLKKIIDNPKFDETNYGKLVAGKDFETSNTTWYELRKKKLTPGR